MHVSEFTSQRQLFPVADTILNQDGFLTAEAIERFKAIDKELKTQDLDLEQVTGISRESWKNWMYQRRAPSGPTLAFLKVLMVHPAVVIETLKTDMYAATLN